MLAVTMVVFLTLFRANLFFLSVFHAVNNLDQIEVFHSFLAGARFDAMVLGFILIPVTIMLLIQAFMEKWPRGFFLFYRFYFGIFWVAACLLTYADFFYFARMGKRMRFAEYTSWNLDLFREQAMALQKDQVTVFSIITVLLLILGLMLIMGLKFGEWKDEYSPRKGSFLEAAARIILPLILVALAARGTIEPHHLALEHSEVSNNTVINEMALNAPWCFDK